MTVRRMVNPVMTYAWGSRDAIATLVVPAFRRFEDFVVKEYLPACFDEVGAWQLPDGGALYAHAQACGSAHSQSGTNASTHASPGVLYQRYAAADLAQEPRGQARHYGGYNAQQLWCYRQLVIFGEHR